MANKAIRLKEKNDTFYPCPYYPVGSIYISVINENPSKWFGGTWVSFGAGRVLVGVDASQSEFNAVNKTGGSKNFQGIHLAQWKGNSNGQHFGLANDDGSYADRTLVAAGEYSANSKIRDETPMNISLLQPFITVYMWERTA